MLVTLVSVHQPLMLLALAIINLLTTFALRLHPSLDIPVCCGLSIYGYSNVPHALGLQWDTFRDQHFVRFREVSLVLRGQTLHAAGNE